MSKWSKKSAERLVVCDVDLIRLFDEVLKHRNCSILDKDKSEHDCYPSLECDVGPHRIDRENKKKLMEFRGFVYGVASQMNVRLKKTIYSDLCHYELRD